MSKNNVNQTINKVAPTVKDDNGKVTVEPTTKVSVDLYNDYKERLTAIYTSVKRSALDTAKLFTEMDERKVLDYEGEGKRYSSLSAFAEEELGIDLSDKQLATYKRITQNYGVRKEDGTYSIDDKFYLYGIEKLDIIWRIPQMNGQRANFDDVVNALGISPNTTAVNLKTIVATAKGLTTTKDNDKPKSKDNDKSKETDVEKSLKQANVKLIELNRELEKAKAENEETIVDLQSFIIELSEKASSKMTDKDFRKYVVDTCKAHIEKMN